MANLASKSWTKREINYKREFIKYTILNMIAMVGVSVYVLADTYFISKAVGPAGLAALNFNIVVFMLLHGIGLMIGVGGGILFSIRVSTGDGEEGNRIFANAILGGIVMSMVFLIAGIVFPTEISLFLGADLETLELTVIYLKTISIFAPFFMLNNIFLSFVRNDHNPRLAMTAMVVSSLFNIVMDYVLMFIFGWGIFGAAFATGLAPILSIAILGFHFSRKEKNLKIKKNRIQIKKIILIMKLGFPMFVTEFATAVTLFTFNMVILGISGNIGVAAYGIIANVAIVVMALFNGLAQGLQPLASTLHGQGDLVGLRKVLKYGVIGSLLISLATYIGIYFNVEAVVEIFNSEKVLGLSEIAITGMLIYFIGFFFAGINVVNVSYLSAKSSTRKAMILSILRSSLVLIPSVLILSRFFGLIGVWASFVLTEFVVMVLSLIRKKNLSL